jgi:hypothetical protein
MQLKTTPPPPLMFPLVLTAEDGAHLYGCCLTFYELLTPEQSRDIYHSFYHGPEQSGSAPNSPLALGRGGDGKEGSSVDSLPSGITSAHSATNGKARTGPIPNPPDRLYAPKSICLLSRNSITMFLRDWLCELYSISKAPTLYSIESYVAQLFNLSMPSPKARISLPLGERHLKLTSPPPTAIYKGDVRDVTI